jgi:hypothetical protein
MVGFRFRSPLVKSKFRFIQNEIQTITQFLVASGLVE